MSVYDRTNNIIHITLILPIRQLCLFQTNDFSMFIKAVGHFIWPTSTTSYSINPYSIHPCCWARSGCTSSWESGWREDQSTESASTATRVSQSWERKVRSTKLQLAVFAYCLYSEIQPRNSLGCRQTWWKLASFKPCIWNANRHQNALLTWSSLSPKNPTDSRYRLPVWVLVDIIELFTIVESLFSHLIRAESSSL